MSSVYTIGVDPDLHDTAIAFCKDGAPYWATTAHVKKTKGTQQQAVVEMVRAVHAELSGLSVAGIFNEVEPRGIAIEAQTLKRTGTAQHKRPQDIVILGNVGGACLGSLHAFFRTAPLLFPAPELWKGQIPKAVMQARLYSDLGWGYEMVGKGKPADYARPLRPTAAFGNVSKGQWKHVGDALLLARWAFARWAFTSLSKLK